MVTHFIETYKGMAHSGWDMRKTSIMDNLNYKMQVHARVCKENKE